jgi:hypothetical protein
MDTNTDRRLEQAVATLTDLIEVARLGGLTESAEFLAMAKMQLVLELNEISDADFRYFCDVVAGRKQPSAAPAKAVHERREADLRLMRRARLCPADIRTPRGGGRRVRQ